MVIAIIANSGLMEPPETGYIKALVALSTTPIFTDNCTIPTIANKIATLWSYLLYK